ncbi:sodium:solute symporter family protein [Paracoccus onubensis]|uniref:sodium:solute symporter family protein n=1 Tax=Paracoccus onubensis TaxID=1675788 RepID=UPI00272EF2C6|nr:sodium:solute symporter family protein [Paracoccus onubensis]MDP0930321.1 sodium:solute symporter family protein [Paracoccus onubensis]
MDQFTLNLIVVGLTFALYVGIAFWARADSTSEFYTAGRGVHPVLNGMATGADWMSAASFISMAGIIAFGGYDASAYLMGWTGGYVLLAMLLAPYLRKFGKFTVPEFIGDRFYSQTARLIAVICLIIASVTYVIGQMKGVGVAFSGFLNMSYEMGLLVGAIIVAFYAVLGGMKGITYTQVAQYVVLIIAYTIPAIFISLSITGNPIPGLGLFSNTVEGGVPVLDQLDTVIQELGFASYTAQTDTTLNIFLFTMSLMIGTAGLPHVIVRFFTVPRVADARSSAGWALVFIALLYLTAPAVGAMARLNFVETMWPNGPQEEAIAIEEMPHWVQNWERTGLLAFEDKNGDGRIEYWADEEKNEAVKVDQDIMVLANPEIAGLPGWVIALVVAGGLAAALSTAAGLLMAISSAVSHDLIKSMIKPDISEKSELMAARISMLVAIAASTWLGLNPPGFAAQTVALAFGIAAASLFPVILMGIFSKRMNSQGAIAGMLAGLLSTVIYIFLHNGWFFIPGTNSFTNADPLLLSIQSTSFGAVGAMINFIVAYVVSNATQEPPKEVQDLVESIRVPKGAGAAQAH